jgi:hypothetical protein
MTIKETDLCVCGHVLEDHLDERSQPCEYPGCACIMFEFEDVDGALADDDDVSE